MTSDLTIQLPTEKMCDAARWFILARDANIYTWGGLSRCIDKTIPHIQEKIDNRPTEHITKWDFAECVYMLMDHARCEYPEVEIKE